MFPSPILPSGIMQSLKRVVKSGGKYANNGNWQDETETEKDFQGTILPLSTKDMNLDTNGTYTTESMKLYTYENFQNGQMILDEDLVRHRVMNAMMYNPYGSNLNIYHIKRVGVTQQ